MLVSMLEWIAHELDVAIEHADGCRRVTIGSGVRKQTVTIREEGKQQVLTSIVLSKSEVTRRADVWSRLARLAWQRNAHTDLVTFTFDHEDNLIGRIRHPTMTLDREELLLYIRALVRECDRFEYLLSGLDGH